MPSVSGNLKSDKLTIQGHGTLAEDVVMSVESDTFLMKMGGDVLMAVSPEGSADINDGGSAGSTLTLNRNTVIAGDLNVTGVSTAVTQAAGNNTTRVATTAFVQGAVSSKANASDVTSSLALKANASDVTSSLALKANASDVTSSLAAKAPLASPALTGVPTAPTAAAGVNTTQVATTSFVHTEIANLVDGASGAYDTLKEIQDLLVADASGATAMLSSIGSKAPLASPTFSGTVTVDAGATLALPSHSNVDSALSAVEAKLNTMQPLVHDPSLPSFEELEFSSAADYGNQQFVNSDRYAPEFYSKHIVSDNRSVNIRYPAHTYKFLDINHLEETFKKFLQSLDKFVPNLKTSDTYAFHNIQGREPYIFDVTKDASGAITCVANNDVVIDVEWYGAEIKYDKNINAFWCMIFSFVYSNTGVPTYMRVITPRKNPYSVKNLQKYANGCLFINSIPITTNATLHASNVAAGIDSVLWSDGVLSLKAKIYDNVQHTTTYTHLLNTTTFNNITIDMNAVNFFRSPSFTNVYKSYNLTPEAFIQKGNMVLQNWSYGSSSDTIPERDSSSNLYDGLIAMPFNNEYDYVIKFGNVYKTLSYLALTNISDPFLIPDLPYNAKMSANSYIYMCLLPHIGCVNPNTGRIDMSSYQRYSTYVMMHEFTHTLQMENLWHYNKDSEAQANYLMRFFGNIKEKAELFDQKMFSYYPKNSVSNAKMFLGTSTVYSYSFYLFYIYMSKYDTPDSEFVRNPRFFKEVCNVIQSRTYLSNVDDATYGIGYSSTGSPLVDASGELSQFEIYNKAYQALKGDSSANILASEYDNIVMASILAINQYEADTTYASAHANISNWAYPDYLKIHDYKGFAIKEMEQQGELKPMIRTIINQAMRDAPTLNTFKAADVIQQNYDKWLAFAENTHITTCRTKGATETDVSSIPSAVFRIPLEQYSSCTLSALQSPQTIISSSNVIVRTVYFPAENNLTIHDITPVTTVDGSGNNVYTYTVTTDSSNTVIAVINNTLNPAIVQAPGLLPLERFTDGTTVWLPGDIQHGTIFPFYSSTVVNAYANITSQMVIVGMPTTNLTDMIGANGMKIGNYADFFDASGNSYVRDKIAICRRGVSSFIVKANNAWAAGAKGLIIIDNSETTPSLDMSGATIDSAMNIPVWRIRPSWYHAHIAPYLVASADNRAASTSFTANWATNYTYPIAVNPGGTPPSFGASEDHLVITEVTDVNNPDVTDM